MPKKYTLKDDTNLFAKELNLNPEDYKIDEIIDIALETIKSSNNPLIMERIASHKSILNRAMEYLNPYTEQAEKDKPGFDVLIKYRNILNAKNFDYHIQELLKEIERDAEKSRVKEKTKPTGQAPFNAKRNEKIRKEYYKLKEKGWREKEAYNLLASKYKLKASSIKTYTKK